MVGSGESLIGGWAIFLGENGLGGEAGMGGVGGVFIIPIVPDRISITLFLHRLGTMQSSQKGVRHEMAIQTWKICRD
jgi:hypothetical protein